MKLKAIFLAGLALTASAVSALAQGTVYSVNVVGFVNLTLPAGFSMISNPLNGPTNTVAALFGASLPNFSKVYKFDPASGNYLINTYVSTTGWTDQNMTLAPGEGVFVRITGSTPVTVTFTGNVQIGSLLTQVGNGFSIISSQVPIQGQLDAAVPQGHGLPLNRFEKVYVFNNSNSATSDPNTYDVYTVTGTNPTTWSHTYTFGGVSNTDAAAPNIGPGQAFFARLNTSSDPNGLRQWAVNFSPQ